MSFACVRALARLAVALSVLAGMSGCKFEPRGLSPGDGPPEDGAPLPMDSGPGMDSTVTTDSGSEIDAMLLPDARVSSQRQKQITIIGSRVQAPAVPGFLADFPVLFSVVDPEIAALASMDGSDIYFVGADGLVRLEYEIEKWVKDTGELVAWVKIPMLLPVVDTVFYVRYGAPELAQPANPRATWSSDFGAVWHLSQDPGPGTAGAIEDSTTGNDGTAHSSMQSSDLVDGQIGDAIDFDGMDDEITFVNSIFSDTPHTISAWVNQRETDNDDAIVVLGTGAANRARWFYGARAGGNVAYGYYSNDHVSGVNIEDEGWKLLHWTYDGNLSRLYVDGAQQGSAVTSGSGVNTQGTAGRIGNVSSTAFGQNVNLDGQVDEVRIATITRPAEWIATEFNNQSSPSTFYTVGPEIAE